MSRTGREKGRKPLGKELRRVVAERDEWRCGICGKKVKSLDEATLDHIVPRAFGGRDRIENLQLAHFRCNIARGSEMTRDLRIAQREGRLG